MRKLATTKVLGLLVAILFLPLAPMGAQDCVTEITGTVEGGGCVGATWVVTCGGSQTAACVGIFCSGSLEVSCLF
jgi:hypothetical protein